MILLASLELSANFKISLITKVKDKEFSIECEPAEGLTVQVSSLGWIGQVFGALYVFKDEFQNVIRKDYIHHNEQNISQKKILPLRILEQKVAAQTNEKYPIHWAEIPLDKTKSYKFYYYERNPNTWNYFDEFVIYKTAYVNPFTGKVLALEDEKNGFFNIVKFHAFTSLCFS